MVNWAEKAGCSPVVVVVGANGEAVSKDLEGGPAIVVPNSDWESGPGSSIKIGLRSAMKADGDIASVVLLVCDQYLVESSTIEALITAHSDGKKSIIASSYADTIGVPVLFDRSCFEELLALPDDSGAKPLILKDPRRVATISFPDGVFDLDATSDLNTLTQA